MKKINWEEFDTSVIEEIPAEKQQFYWVGYYYFLAKAALDMRGEEGDRVMRKGIRAYGRERGQRMRRIANAKGYPADLCTLFDHYDLMGDPRFVHPPESFLLTPEVKRSITGRCPDAEMWGRMPDGMHIGSIYCEEVHHQIYEGFDPAVQVNLAETLTTGGPHCRFVLYCRKANQKEYPLPPYVPQKWDDFENDMVASIHTMSCLMYLKMSRAVKDGLGEEVVREALQQFCYFRGYRMHLLHERQGLEISLKSFLEQGDVFLDNRYEVTIDRRADGSYEVQTKRDILEEVAQTYDCQDLKKLYDEVSYEYLLAGYAEGMTAEILHEDDPEKIHVIFRED